MSAPVWQPIPPDALKELRAAADAPSAAAPTVLAPFVFAAYPEAVAAAKAHGGELTLTNVSRHPSRIVKDHVLANVFFAWKGSTTAFESWFGLFAAGPLGLARLSQRPAAVEALFAHERPLKATYRWFKVGDTAKELAHVLSRAHAESHQPDTLERPDRHLHMRSGLVTKHLLENIDTNGPYRALRPLEPAEWSALRPKLHEPEGEPTPAGFEVRWCTADAIGGERVRFQRVRASIVRADYSIDVSSTSIGDAKMTAPAQLIVGRPFTIAWAPERAGVMVRADWCGRRTSRGGSRRP